MDELCEVAYDLFSPIFAFGPPLIELLTSVQDYMAHGSQGLFTQAGYNDPLQDDGSQNHFGMSNVNSLQSQVNLLF